MEGKKTLVMQQNRVCINFSEREAEIYVYSFCTRERERKKESLK